MATRIFTKHIGFSFKNDDGLVGSIYLLYITDILGVTQSGAPLSFYCFETKGIGSRLFDGRSSKAHAAKVGLLTLDVRQ